VVSEVAIEEEEGEQVALEQAVMGEPVVQGVRQVVAWVKERIALHAVWAAEEEAGQGPCPTWAADRVPTVRRPPTST